MADHDLIAADLEVRIGAELETVRSSDQRLIRTADALSEDQWRAPSLLPGWSRAHVIAHLALNGEGLARALEGLADGRIVAIYDSQEQRDNDIDHLAAEDTDTIRERLFAATTRFREAADHVTEVGRWAGAVNRLPEGPVWPADTVPSTRRREVEIHHADLDAGYSHHDWPADFSAELLDQLALDHAASGFTASATDLGRTWTLGASDPVVSGSAADLGWWLTGRGHGEGLDSGDDPLPALGPWTRAPQPDTE